MAPTRAFLNPSRSFRHNSEPASLTRSSMGSSSLFRDDNSSNSIENLRLQPEFTTSNELFENSSLIRRRISARRSHPTSSCLTGTPTHHPVYETDPITLVRRQKQIDYGKNTEEYKKYVTLLPKEKRTPRSLKTPDRYQKCSRRSWDGQIKVWRLCLHAWATNGSEPSEEQCTNDEPNEPNSSLETKPTS